MNINTNWLLPEARQDEASITKDWQPSHLQLIDGVQIHEIRPVLTTYGHLTEILRAEWLPNNDRVDQIFASTLLPGAISAWHAHATTTDRLFVVSSQIRIVLYDARPDSPTCSMVNEFRIGVQRPSLLIIPPKVWHGVQNYCNSTAVLLNAVDSAYCYDGPDHWRVPLNSTAIPYSFPDVLFH